MSRLIHRGAALLAALALLVTVAAPAAASASGYRTESRFIHVVDGPANDQHIAIDTTLYVPVGATAAHPAPAVIGAHGFGENKGALAGVAEFLADRGYAVLLYSARGFGRSGGKISLDSPSYDVKDVEQLASWLGTQPEIERDSKGPVVGMFGDSYGGGVTLLAAAYDPAIRVAIPILTWNSLISSFLPNDVAPSNPQPGVFKQGWASVFLGGGGGGFSGGGGATPPPTSACPGFVPGICEAYVATAGGGQPTPQALATLAMSSPGSVIGNIKVPTLLLQGEADTLFNLNEAEATEAGVRANGAPARMVWVPGGHSNLGAILSGSTASVLKAAIDSWLDRWLKGNRSVITGGDTWYDPATGRYLPFSSRTTTS
ncbi:MAG: alpha/beta hydrolase family protein, partial [Actinomycetota bacterium]